MNNVLAQDYETREVAINKNHAANVFNTRRRQELAKTLVPALKVDPAQAYLRCDQAQLPEVNRVIAQGLLLARARMAKKTIHHRKTKLLPSPQDCNANHLKTPIFQLALARQVIQTISNYLGYVPILTAADFWLNTNHKAHAYEPTDGQYNTSMYHLDWADNRFVKIFVFCVDINESNGALVLVNANKSSQIREALGYKFDRKHNTSTNTQQTNGLFLTDHMMAPLLTEGDQITLYGPAGTCYFADTARCFHYGGRNQQAGDMRIMGVLRYIRPGAMPLHPLVNGQAPFQHLATPDMPELQRLVLGSA